MRKLYVFMGLFLILLTASLILNEIFRKNQPRNIDKEEFVNALIRKQHLIDDNLQQLKSDLSEQGLKGIEKDFYSKYSGLFHSEGIAFYVYSNNRLYYWNTNNIPLSNHDTLFDHTVNKLGNGWYYTRKQAIDSVEVLALSLLKKTYSYENQYLENKFQKDFHIASSVDIIKDPKRGTAIHNSKGDYLFSLYPSTYKRGATFLYYLSVIFFFAAFLFLFLFFDRLFQQFPSRGVHLWLLLLIAVFLGAVRFLSLHFQFPENIYQLAAFDPSFYASSAILPNLGDLLLHLICLWFLIWLVNRYLREINFNINSRGNFRYIVASGYLLLNIAFFALIYYLFYSLIINSSFSFDFHHFFDLEISGLLMLLTIFVLFFIYFLWIDLFIFKISVIVNFRVYSLLFVLLTLVIIGICFMSGLYLKWYSILFFFLTNFAVALMVYQSPAYNYPRLIAIILVTVIFSMYFIDHYTGIEERNKRKILVTNLESERDRICELLLRRREDEIAKDRQISQWMINHLANEPKIFDYLRKEYFGGFFNKYDLQISVCAPEDDLTVEYEYRTEQHHCYSFFDKMLKREGLPLGYSRFYFLDNINGRISYIGVITYHEEDSHEESTLYISLDSKLTKGPLGYPELLLTENLAESDPLEGYAYAKYKNGQLIRKSGEYAYPMKMTKQFDKSGEYSFMDYQGYNHLVYNVGDDSMIVISKPLQGFLDRLAQFSYIFAFFYLATLLLIFISGLPHNISRFNYNFKNKIKLSMVLILILSLIAVGIGNIYYTTQQFQEQQRENISEKMESLIVELEDKLGAEDELNEEYRSYIESLLEKFSKVFYVDMNLYDLEGKLLSSSRPQVFERGLISRRMNPEAYHKLSDDKLPQFIHNEEIGNMRYHSAYVPFYNDRNEVLAYLNIPYFTRQKALQKEIYTIVMVIVNIYVFLIILGTVIAVLVSNTITRPLKYIQKNLGRIGLDRKNEKIDYKSHDEIGELVGEYNRMIDELEANAEKLAQTERETAWREMAKQIAHEIKNPLTPMKLKVQYLKRAWDDQVDNFDERIKQFADSMITQINTLSEIASEFSNFAKMPRARNRKLDLDNEIDKAVNLFEDTENIEINKQNESSEKVYIYADQDQISRVFSNLMKNAIQSIPAQRKGMIQIKLTRKNEKALVTISDNGSGVPEDLRGKLFRPNFTTKSGGMGMGLAISKKIIEDFEGTITYETEKDKGTTFYLEFPAYDE